MSEQLPAHACIEITPSGSYRSSIGWTKIGEKCSRCGVLIIEKYAVWPKASESNEPPSETAAV